MRGALVRLDHDWGSVIDAAQRDVADDQQWADGIAARLHGLLALKSDPALVVVEHDAECTTARYRAFGMPRHVRPQVELATSAGLSVLGRDGFRGYYYPSRSVTTHGEIERELPPTVRELALAQMAEWRAQRAFEDVLGALAYPEPGIVITLFAMHDRPIAIPRHERVVLARLMLHLESNYRLRRRPESVIAVLDADGRVLDRTDAAPDDDALAAYVTQRNALRKELLWPALIDGRASVVTRGSDRARRYFVLENPPQAHSFRALTPAEVAVVAQASHGHSTKMIAFALGVSPSVVSARLASAAAKVGVATRVELVHLAAILTRDPRAGLQHAGLTDAERDVLELLRCGLSNEEIARMRSRSVRTIANQVAALLRKTKSGSRRALVASVPLPSAQQES